MYPPFFSQLGRPARDVSGRGYNIGFIQADTSAKSGNVELKAGASQNIAAGRLFGDISVKYNLNKYGATVTESWNTDNDCSVELILNDQLAKGLKFILNSSYAPFVGRRSAKASIEFKHENAAVCSSVKLNGAGGPVLSGSAVMGQGFWNIGCSGSYDPAQGRFISHSFAATVDQQGLGFHTFLNNGREYGGSVYQKVNGQVELAAHLGWTAGQPETNFGVAAKVDLDDSTIFRAKINNASQLAFSLSNWLKPSLRATVSASVNLRNYNAEGPKLGIGFEYFPSSSS